LQPETQAYPVGATREAGSDVTIKLSKWVPFRLFQLTYYGQEGLLVSKPNGVTFVDSPHYVGNNLISLSFTLDPAPSDGLRCEGHVACIEFEARPSPHHKPHIVCVTSPPPSPPSPPLPPPPAIVAPVILPPPVASPAVLSGAIRAVRSCQLGGSAEVLKVSHGGSSPTEVRIAVNLDTWVEGNIVTLGILGEGLRVKQAVKATSFEGGPETLADFSFSFKLLETPSELMAFAVVLQGEAFDRIMSLSCSKPPQRKLSPPPFPPSPRPQTIRASSSSVSSISNLDSYGKTGNGIDDDLEDNDEDSYGSSISSPTVSPSKSSRAHEESGGGMGSTFFVTVLCALGVGAFVAYKKGKLDFLVRTGTAIRVDGSEEKERIVEANPAVENGIEDGHGYQMNKSAERPCM